VEQGSLHPLAAMLVSMHQGIIENEQGGTACLLQQVCVGKAGENAQLLLRAEAQPAHVVAMCSPDEIAWQEGLVELQACIGEKEAEIMVQSLHQGRLQTVGGFPPLPLEQLMQQIQRLSPALQGVVPTRQTRQLRFTLRQSFAYALLSGLVEPTLQQKDLTLPGLVGLAGNACRALQPLDVLFDNIGAMFGNARLDGSYAPPQIFPQAARLGQPPVERLAARHRIAITQASLENASARCQFLR